MDSDRPFDTDQYDVIVSVSSEELEVMSVRKEYSADADWSSDAFGIVSVSFDDMMTVAVSVMFMYGCWV